MKRLAEVIFKNFPSAQYASGKSEIVMKCPFCGDSSDPRSKHFYISLKDNQPHFYNCFKCNESGILDSKKLRMMMIYDADVGLELDYYNKSIKCDSKYASRKNGSNHVIVNRVNDTELSLTKLKYINTRLGLNLTLADAEEKKICLNIYDLLNANRITKLTRDRMIMDELDTYFLGFISMDNGFVTMRNLAIGKVNKAISRRYTDYNIFGDADNSRRYYTIPTSINTLLPVEIHIAEGAFDILSIYYNLRGQNNVQNIYTSINGKTYLNLIKLFIQDIGLINVVFHIYVDNDIDQWTLYNIKKVLTPLKIVAYIHQNVYAGEKDFGVKRDLIQERVQLLSQYHI